MVTLNRLEKKYKHKNKESIVYLHKVKSAIITTYIVTFSLMLIDLFFFIGS